MKNNEDNMDKLCSNNLDEIFEEAEIDAAEGVIWLLFIGFVVVAALYVVYSVWFKG